MLKAFKYRLSPTPNQEMLINKHFGCVRVVYNMALAQSIAFYKEHKDNPIIEEYTTKKGEAKTREKKSLNVYDTKAMIPIWKQKMEYLKEVNSLSLQEATRNLDGSYQKFYKKQGGHPKFKSKKSSRQSFAVPQKTVVDFENQKVKLPKFLEGIKCIFHRQFTGEVKSSTISQTPSGKFFISILVDTKEQKPLYQLPVTIDTTIGIDLGLKDFVIDNLGNKFVNPKFFKTSLPRLRRLSKRHSRRTKKSVKVFEYQDDLISPILTKKGKPKFHLELSNNTKKSKLKLARLHERVANQRKDYLHQVSAKLAYNPDINCIAMETLKVKNMIKNRKLSRAIADVGWSSFATYLGYKLDNQGKTLIKIDTFYPSSKKCSTPNCSYINQDLKLEDREWKCPCCNTLHDRDINAGKNIKAEALRIYFDYQNTLGTRGIQACGDTVRPSLTRLVSLK